MAEDDALTRRKEELARRLNLLLASLVSARGVPYTYEEVAAHVSQQGQRLTRKRWNYMLRADGPLVTDNRLFGALSTLFGVDPEYLITWGPDGKPGHVEAQLEFIHALRTNKVTQIAARTLSGEISADGLRQLSSLLDELGGAQDDE
ncbi:hypothetical protein [Agromyces sp. NPDC058126]|uniref:hypothetical protein n=1 Tax=Agromyces sp. NPDC058126 TaxID=3346350 RepID=UPI0036DBC2BC